MKGLSCSLLWENTLFLILLQLYTVNSTGIVPSNLKNTPKSGGELFVTAIFNISQGLRLGIFLTIGFFFIIRVHVFDNFSSQFMNNSTNFRE